VNNIPRKPTVIAALCATMLAACGGSGDSNSPSTSTPPTTTPPAVTTPSITGKAIDGYLVGATVCLDLNANNVCDSGEPSATTDANGNFTLPYTGDTSGKRLLVQVTPATKDLSRPAGFTFPASYTMSAVLEGGTTGQHVSPLTTLVTAQMEAGMSRDEAVRAVQALLGSNVDPTADFVANGDAATTAKAIAIIDTITSLAKDGKADATIVRNVLNAMVTKGDVAVTQADVDTQAAKPLYTLADASKVLAAPVYSYIDSLMTNLGSPTQAVIQIQNNALRKDYQARQTAGGAWEAAASDFVSLGDPTSEFDMKADGTWTRLLQPSDLKAPLPLTTIGHRLAGTDPVTGITFQYESRDVDMSNLPAFDAVTGGRFGPDTSLAPALQNAKLPAGTQGYLGIQSYDTDRVVLPIDLGGCPVPYQSNSQCPIAPGLPTAYPSAVINDTALPSPLTSIRQLVGRTMIEPVMSQVKVQINADGTAQFSLLNSVFGSQVSPGQPLGMTAYTTVTGKWSIYARNENVMVFDMSRDAAATVARLGWNAWPVGQGAKLVFALRDGQLHSGVLFPAGYTERAYQFRNGLPSVLTTAVNQPR